MIKQKSGFFVAALAAIGFMGATGVAQAAPVSWQGQTWDESYGNTTLSVDGSGNLVITPANPANYAAAHYNTSAAFRASATQSVQVRFIDTAVAAERRELWIEDETTGPFGSAGGWLQVVARGATYQIGYNDYDADLLDNESVDFSNWVSVNTLVSRTAGEHLFSVSRALDGTIDVSIDGDSYLSLTSSQFGPNYFGDVYLGMRGGTATFTQFDSSTEPHAVAEPTTFALAGLSLLGMMGVGRRRSRA